MNFNAEMEKRKNMVEEALKAHLPPEDLYPTAINRAMRYAVMNGGKRLRPILLLEGAAIAGGDVELAMPAACAVEMIHCYSLVHDDLPAMDNDDFRRGKPTCHRVFGEAVAILAGDGLLTLAFEKLASLSRCASLSPENVLRVVEEISKAVGHRGMIAGQVVDLESEGKQIDEGTLKFMHAAKTGALFRASLVAGALLFGADDGLVQALDGYARHFGMAFQITDDILDVVGDQQETGKPVGSDYRNQKSTFVSLFGIEESIKKARQNIDLALRSLENLGREADFLRALARQVLVRKA